MQGFVHFSIPLWLRRAITMLPSFVVILAGMDATKVLVLSQVVLSFGIALALIPLLMFTNRTEIMGDLVNTRWIKIAAWGIILIVVCLNLGLLFGDFFGLT